ncbi:MAG TPA: hypothetical protein VG992_02745 [Candidatus Saccharimonadales bacterium]|nr:hypothetical protein [Candidatus Saccharimonadales bacterium]
MDQNQSPPATPQDDENALETPESQLQATAAAATDSNVTDTTGGGNAPTPKGNGGKRGLRRFNVYLIFFLFIIVVAGAIIAVAYFQSKNAATTNTLKTQDLTQSTLNQVANSDATVGNSGVVLNVQSSAVFAGKVLVRSDLEVAGSLQIGGTVALSALTVSGSTQLGQLSVNKNLSVSGDTGIQGTLTVAKSLQVNGNGSFSGSVTAPQITTASLQLNSDLRLTHHIIAGGPTPGRTNGSALGSGGTASVSGSDTSGTITINTGSGPNGGCFVTITFARAYSSTPHVLVTPVGSEAGSINYYVTRNTTSFSLCDEGTPPGGRSFAFDYFVVD